VDELRLAIIGYGLAGRIFHAPLIAATAGLRVAAIVTGDPERRTQAEREHPTAERLSNPGELWQRGGAIDAVVVAAPNDAHAALAMAAIDHHLPVVVDKPLAVTARDALAVVEHAERTGVALTVYQNRRWDSDQLLLAKLIAAGRLGTVIRYESRFERWRPEARPGVWRDETPSEAGGGQLLDLGSHLVDQALHNFGPAAQVYAEIDSRRGTTADDDAFLALTHTGGVISHLHGSAVVAAPGPRLRALGSKGALLVPNLDTQEDRLRAGERPDTVADWGVEPTEVLPRLIVGEQSTPLVAPPGDWPAFYRRLATALREGGPPPVDPRDAVAVLAVLEAARVSAAEGRVVALGPGVTQ
jgi:scyllo-inositol 2-dehydrogenase (NADP+)